MADITNKDLLRHMQGMKYELQRDIGKLDEKIGRLEKRVGGLETRMDRVEYRLDDMDKRFDKVDFALQRLYERRIELTERVRVIEEEEIPVLKEKVRV